MLFGVMKYRQQTIVATRLGARLVDFSKAHATNARVIEGQETAPLRDVAALIKEGSLTRSHHKRITEFVQRNGRLEEYLVEGDPQWALPFRPGKIICIGRNYHAHVREMGNDLPEEPLFFNKVPSACIGTGESISAPRSVGRVDHEGELAVVIGKRASHVSEDEAQECVAGYTLVNDVTARDMQKVDTAKGKPWFRSKNLDTFCPLGPVVLLADALDWPPVVDITVRVNGETRQHSNTGKFIFSLPRLIAYVSQHMALEPGDVIATGTPEGVGPLEHGDVVEVEIPEIGTLKNPVVRG